MDIKSSGFSKDYHMFFEDEMNVLAKKPNDRDLRERFAKTDHGLLISSSKNIVQV
jgi:hypothetical protein